MGDPASTSREMAESHGQVPIPSGVGKLEATHGMTKAVWYLPARLAPGGRHGSSWRSS